jgi:penicillin-binding protein 2
MDPGILYHAVPGHRAGQMLVTPLQMANAMCIVANKDISIRHILFRKWKVIPPDDSVLNKYFEKHEVLTHI